MEASGRGSFACPGEAAPGADEAVEVGEDGPCPLRLPVQHPVPPPRMVCGVSGLACHGQPVDIDGARSPAAAHPSPASPFAMAAR